MNGCRRALLRSRNSTQAATARWKSVNSWSNRFVSLGVLAMLAACHHAPVQPARGAAPATSQPGNSGAGAASAGNSAKTGGPVSAVSPAGAVNPSNAANAAGTPGIAGASNGVAPGHSGAPGSAAAAAAPGAGGNEAPAAEPIAIPARAAQ